MTSPNPTDGSDVDRSLGGQKEAVCHLSEAAWKQGLPPRIEDELPGSPRGAVNCFGPCWCWNWSTAEVSESIRPRRSTVTGSLCTPRRSNPHSPTLRRPACRPPSPGTTIRRHRTARPAALPATVMGGRGPRRWARSVPLAAVASASCGSTPEAVSARSTSPATWSWDARLALKEIKDLHADDLKSRARFVLEAEVTGRLEHPGIVPI